MQFGFDAVGEEGLQELAWDVTLVRKAFQIINLPCKFISRAQPPCSSAELRSCASGIPSPVS